MKLLGSTVIFIVAILASASGGTLTSLLTKTHKHEFELSVVDKRTNCTNDGAVKAAYGTRNEICMDEGIWKNFSSSLDDVFTGFNDTKLELVLAFLSRYSGSDRGLLGNLDSSEVKSFVEALGEEHIKKLPPKSIYVPYLVMYMSDSQMKHLPRSVIKDIIERPQLAPTTVGVYTQTNLSHGVWRKILDRIGAEPLSNHVNDLIGVLFENGQRSTLRIWKLSDDILKMLIDSAAFCKKLDGPRLMQFGERREKASLMTPTCAGAATWTKPKTCDSRLRVFPDTILSDMGKSDMDESCWKSMSQDFVKNFNTVVTNGRCSQLAIEKLGIPAMQGLTSDCVLDRFLNREVRQIKLGTGWMVLPDDVLTGFDRSSLEKIPEEDWRAITLKQKEAYIEVIKDDCDLLPKEFFKYNRGVKLSNNCFDSLDDKVKGYALIAATLENDVLVDVTSMSKWTVEDSRDRELKGAEIFKIAGGVRNIDQIISYMSGNDSGSHVCEEVSSDAFLANNVLQQYCNKRCIESLKFNLTFAYVMKLRPRIMSLIVFDELLKTVTGGDWKKMRPDIFKKIMDGENFCKDMKIEVMRSLGPDSLKVIDAKCLSQVTFLKDLYSETVKELLPSAFKLITAEMLTGFDLNKLSPEQFAMLGEDTTDQHPATLFDKERMRSLNPKLVAALPGPAWVHVPVTGFESISKTMMVALHGTNMTHWKAAQVKELPSEALGALNEGHAADIGKEYDGTADSPLPFLISSKIDETVKKVLKERQKSK